MNKRVCSFDNCEKVLYAKTLCMGHYQQRRKGFPLTPLRPSTSVKKSLAEGGKVCTQCNTWLSMSEYYDRTDSGYQSKCKKCFGHIVKISKYLREGGKYPQESLEYLRSLGREVNI